MLESSVISAEFDRVPVCSHITVFFKNGPGHQTVRTYCKECTRKYFAHSLPDRRPTQYSGIHFPAGPYVQYNFQL